MGSLRAPKTTELSEALAVSLRILEVLGIDIVNPVDLVMFSAGSEDLLDVCRRARRPGVM